MTSDSAAHAGRVVVLTLAEAAPGLDESKVEALGAELETYLAGMERGELEDLARCLGLLLVNELEVKFGGWPQLMDRMTGPDAKNPFGHLTVGDHNNH